MELHRRVRTRGGVIVAAAMAATALLTGSATADPGPPPDNRSDALTQYRKLNSQAEKLNEDYLAAKYDLARKRGALRQANADLAKAKAAERRAESRQEQFRGQVDQMSAAALHGARFSQISALLTAESPRDYLARASALRVLSQHYGGVLGAMTAATNKAESAQRRAASDQSKARRAAAAAAQLTRNLASRKQALSEQISQVNDALESLGSAARAQLSDPGDQGVYITDPGAAGAAVQAALSQRGKPYQWGGAGPNAYDCSGLTLWAFNKVGIALPHSARAQYQMGTPVSYGQWKPGDLLFWGSSPSTIHHVAIYIGGGKMVHAFTEGAPVGADKVDGWENDYIGAKRLIN